MTKSLQPIITTVTTALLLLALTACQHKEARQPAPTPQPREDLQAKALLQGIWIDHETEEVQFRAQGDTIYYPDTLSQPTTFRILNDTLELGGHGYAIVRQGENLFWFRNQNGDVVRLAKSFDPIHQLAFSHQRPQGITTYTTVVSRDSVVMLDGERYHWYITINPTKYKVIYTTYNNDGVSVDNVYYDNIIHISLFQGARKVYSSDYRKQHYNRLVPQGFLEQAIMTDMAFTHADARGFHFVATVCRPDGVSCYMVEITVGRDGTAHMQLME